MPTWPRGCSEPSSALQPGVRHQLLPALAAPQRPCDAGCPRGRAGAASDAGSKGPCGAGGNNVSSIKKKKSGLFPVKSRQIWAVRISWVYLATTCGCFCLELGVTGCQPDTICSCDKSQRPLVALGNAAKGWGSSPAPVLPPHPAPAPARASRCTGGRWSDTCRCPGGKGDTRLLCLWFRSGNTRGLISRGSKHGHAAKTPPAFPPGQRRFLAACCARAGGDGEGLGRDGSWRSSSC